MAVGYINELTGGWNGYAQVFKPDGSVNQNFAGGEFITDIEAFFPGGDLRLSDVIQLANGQFLLSGTTTQFTGSGVPLDAALILLNADGTLDTNFDNDGYRF